MIRKTRLWAVTLAPWVIFSLAVVGLPLVLGAAGYAVLSLQSDELWKGLMPAADFAEPRRGLKALVISANDLIEPWRRLYETNYTYPDGGRLWFVLKEQLGDAPGTPRTETWSEAFAVDAGGAIYRFKKLISTEVVFEQLTATETSQLLARARDMLADEGVVVGSDPTTLEEMAKRLPFLAARQATVFFSGLGVSAQDPGGVYQTQLQPIVVVRLAAFIGIFLAATLILAILADAQDNERVALALLGMPLAMTAMIFLTLVPGRQLQWLWPTLPYVVWLVLAGAAIWLGAKHFPRPLYLLRHQWREGLSRLPQWVTAVVVLVGLFAYFGPSFFTSDLTLGTGDVVRYIRGAMYVYDYGYWPLEKVLTEFGPSSHFSSYPQGLSVIHALAMWIVNPRPDRVFFPGPQTGAIWLLVGGWLALLNFSVVAAFAAVVRARFRQHIGLWLVSLIFILVYVPTTRGVLHAAESVLWPFVALTLVALIVWRNTASWVAGVAAITLTAGQIMLKREGWLIALLLISPWVLASLEVEAIRSRRRRASLAWMAAVTGILVGPLLFLEIFKTRLGISDGDFRQVSISYLLAHPRTYVEVLRDSGRVLFGTSGTVWVPRAVIPLGFMFGLLGVLQFIRPSWRQLIVPAGIAAYLVILPAAYAFSNWGNVWIHIAVSWGRLLAPAIIAAGFYTFELLSSSQRSVCGQADEQDST